MQFVFFFINSFGDEERYNGDFPFAINETFKIAIGFTETKFVLAVNGKLIGEFAYRSSNLLNGINGFKIQGKKECLLGYLRLNTLNVEM